MHYQYNYYVPLVTKLMKWNLNLTYEIDNKHYKYLSREKSLALSAQPEELPWNFKLERSSRTNIVDRYASRKYIINDTLPSQKISLGADYYKMDESKFRSFSAELALNSPQFAKFDI